MERDTWVCFLIGLGCGIAIGMLFAPQPGAQIRQGIKQKADEGAEYVKKRGTDLKDSAAEVIEQGKRAVGLAHEQVAEPLGGPAGIKAKVCGTKVDQLPIRARATLS